MNEFLDFIYMNRMIMLLLTFVIATLSQGYLTKTFAKYSKVKSTSNLTGMEVAKQIMNANGVYDVSLEQIDINLGDHFDPRSKTVRLSPKIANQNSIAAQAVAAHEIGHVLQHQEKSSLLKIRNAILPFAQLGSKGMWFAIILGIAFQMTGLLYLGIILFVFIIMFQVATLPVEFDASSRAKQQLLNLNIITSQDEVGVKKVLNAAALTYVVAVVSSILTLLRLLSIANRR